MIARLVTLTTQHWSVSPAVLGFSLPAPACTGRVRAGTTE